MDLGAVLGYVTAALIAVGVLLWRLVGSGAEHATKTQVEEVMAELNRQSVLARELEKSRGTERQELRFESYGKLWAEMRPLAIYDTSPIDAEAMARMSQQLTAWYFSASDWRSDVVALGARWGDLDAAETVCRAAACSQHAPHRPEE